LQVWFDPVIPHPNVNPSDGVPCLADVAAWQARFNIKDVSSTTGMSIKDAGSQPLCESGGARRIRILGQGATPYGIQSRVGRWWCLLTFRVCWWCEVSLNVVQALQTLMAATDVYSSCLVN
jgi:hypothetical protein